MTGKCYFVKTVIRFYLKNFLTKKKFEITYFKDVTLLISIDRQVMSESVLSWKIFTPGGIVLGYDDGNTLVLSEDNYRKGLADGSIMKFSELEALLQTDAKESVKKPSDTCMCITCGFARSIGSSLAGSRVWTSCDNSSGKPSSGNVEEKSNSPEVNPEDTKTKDKFDPLKDCNCSDCQLIKELSKEFNLIVRGRESLPALTRAPIGMTQEQLDAALGFRFTPPGSDDARSCSCWMCNTLRTRDLAKGTPEKPVEKDNHLYIPSCACKKCATATFELKERSRRQKAQEKFDAKQNKKTEKRRAKFLSNRGGNVEHWRLTEVFEPDERIRRQRAQEKFDARQNKKAEKRRAKFETKMELKKEWVEKDN